MSDSVRPHRRQPTRLSRPWDSPGKNTGVGCHFLLQCMKVKSESEVAQSCPTLATPWTAAYQVPPSMGFSRQEHWSGVPSPSPYLRLVSCFSASWISPHPGCTVGPLLWMMAWRPRHPLFTYMAGTKSSMWARYVLLFLATPSCMWDLSSPTRDQTLTPCIGSSKS